MMQKISTLMGNLAFRGSLKCIYNLVFFPKCFHADFQFDDNKNNIAQYNEVLWCLPIISANDTNQSYID